MDGIITVYHGSDKENIVPEYNTGSSKKEYGCGFYVTEVRETACEWALAGGRHGGFVHAYELDTRDLKVFNFRQEDICAFIAEVMKHRDIDSSARYRKFKRIFIDKFGADTTGYDIIHGWHADAALFLLLRRFVRDEIDYEFMEAAIRLGGCQICIKSENAFSRLKGTGIIEIAGEEYERLYAARNERMTGVINEMIESKDNIMKHGFTYMINH